MTFEEVYEKLDKFIHYLAHRHANGVVLMDHDEISGELYEELVKGFQYYTDLPEGQLLAVLRRMMDNRIAELTHRYYSTHRGLAANSLSLSELEDADEPTQVYFQNTYQYSSTDSLGMSDPSDIVESQERVARLYNTVSDEARQVLDAIFDDDGLVAEHIALSGIRASFVYKKNGTVTVRPFHVVNSSTMNEKEVKKAFKEIKETYNGL